MSEIENDNLLFSSLIKINYDKRFIKTAQNYVEGLSLLAGANKTESLKISLLLEECLVFIIDKYLDRRTAAYIEICFMVLEDNMVRIAIKDIGPPIHEKMIPPFDVDNENSEAGLWFKLVKELADDFVFENQYSAGWLIKIDKKIEEITYKGSLPEITDTAGRENTSGEKKIRRATAEDIPALVDLAYMTYRYSYAADFYDENLLKKKIDEKIYEIIVVEQFNKVVGASIIKYSGNEYSSAEIGSAMVLPEYRSGNTMLLLFRELNKYVVSNPCDCEFFEATAVTTHIFSQKGLARLNNGFKPMMISLNMVPRPDFIGIDENKEGRESLLFCCHLNGKLKTSKIYAASGNHTEIINELIAGTGNNVEIVIEYSEPEECESQISVQQFDSLGFGAISIKSLGKDWFSMLSKKIFSMISSGIESIKVTIPSSLPLPAGIERLLNDMNLVYCGLSVTSLEKIDHAYCLSTKPVHFEGIHLFDSTAQKLLKQIEADYKRIKLKN